MAGFHGRIPVVVCIPATGKFFYGYFMEQETDTCLLNQ